MPAIKITQKGEFEKITRYLTELKTKKILKILDKYGRLGVSALRDNTPIDTGLTAASWYYEIDISNKRATLSFHNANVNRGVNIAIILQYGHGTGTGGWVEGRDYINPALQPIFARLADEAWEEVTKI
jgi:hypothetical protein